MTPEQKDYIHKNRLTVGMTRMAHQLGISYPRVRKYMIEQDITLSKKEVSAIRAMSMTMGIPTLKPRYLQDDSKVVNPYPFWHLNPVTMKKHEQLTL